MRSCIRFLLFLFLFFFLFIAPFALAQKPSESDFIPIVRCGTERFPNTPCDFCELFQITNRVIKLILYYIIPPLAVVAFIWAGIYYLFSGGNPQNISRAHKIFQVTVIGILIAYSGWLIVNTILQQVVDPKSGLIWWPWNKLPQCAPEGVSEMPSTPIAPTIPFPPAIPPSTKPPPSQKAKCETDGESQELVQLVSCVQQETDLKNIDLGDETKGTGRHTCNLSAGSVSCHYGGPSLTPGCNGTAHAVDFGGYPGSVGSETNEKNKNAHIENYKKIIEVVSKCGGINARCESGTGIVSCDNPAANHVHANDIGSLKCGCK